MIDAFMFGDPTPIPELAPVTLGAGECVGRCQNCYTLQKKLTTADSYLCHNLRKCHAGPDAFFVDAKYDKLGSMCLYGSTRIVVYNLQRLVEKVLLANVLKKYGWRPV
jgi:hypothetical protein